MEILTASAAIAQVLERRMSVSEILNASLQRINARESDVKAWTFLAVEAARQQVTRQEADCRTASPSDLLSQLPLLGIPGGIKEIFAHRLGDVALSRSRLIDRSNYCDPTKIGRSHHLG